MIRVIDKVTTFRGINKKAEEISKFCEQYDGCLIATDEEYKEFRKLVKFAVEHANRHYPRTKPFEIYNDNYEANHLCVCVKGNTEQDIVRIYFTPVKGVFHQQRNEPLESISYALKGEEVQNG